MSLPEIYYLREILDYDPISGDLTWKVKKANRITHGMKAGCVDKNGYLRVTINYKLLMVHRIIWALHYGDWPHGDIDHINHNRADNRLCNLRNVTRQENLKNISLSNKNKSGHIGIRERKKLGKETVYEANIVVDGRNIYLGRFNKKEEAIKARKDANHLYGFHENHGKLLEQPQSSS